MPYLTVSNAKPRLERLVDKVLKKGERVVLRHGKRLVQLTEYVATEAIPPRPPGYFAVEESPAEYARANRLAEGSPHKPE